MTAFVFNPTDTLFFRDGRPYNQDDDGLALARSLFPPYPSTLTGAARVALALGNGWDGKAAWTQAQKAVLGDGPHLAPRGVRFGAPVLVRRDGDAWVPLFPAPRTLVGHENRQTKESPVGWEDFDLLRPGRPLACDLGPAVRLPVAGRRADGSHRKPVTNLWLTPAGFSRVLKGSKPEFGPGEIVNGADLWHAEPRIGLALEKESRTAKRGQLYAPVHIRLAADVALCLPVENLPAGWSPSRMVPLGGEHRSAMVTVLDRPLDWPRVARFTPTPKGDRLCVTVTLVSPARVDPAWLKPGEIGGRRTATIVSACLGPPLAIGGWDSRRESKGPLALRSFLPAGSTWFLHVARDWTAEDLPPWLGDPTDACHGYGRYVLGTFSDPVGNL